MDWNTKIDARVSLISGLCGKLANSYIGRTALMKFCYLLQTVRGVPLGYNFTLYSYGPFDSDLLSDLNSAQMLAVVESKVEFYSGGYGYHITKGPAADEFLARSSNANFLSEYADSINWVLKEFGSMSAADLELIGTIVFVDREALEK